MDLQLDFYITDDPSQPMTNITLFVAGGGTRTFKNFNATTQSYAPEAATSAVLLRTSAASYEQRFSDGSKEVFSTATAVTGAGRKVFLTQRVDAAGNAVTLTYDGSFRLVAVTDVIGQVSTVTYGQAGDTLKITRITDPFGRTAQFAYDGAGNLQQITDMIGMTSQFTYTGSFINALTTPYGTTTFAYGDLSTNAALPSSERWLEATDPLGGKERLEYRHDAPGIATTEPAATAPPFGENANLQYRNSFYWDKKAMMEAPGDYTKAKITHWLHIDANTASGVVESEKQPLENRVAYQYPGQNSGLTVIGTSESPTSLGRKTSEGQAETYSTTYNTQGNPTRQTDPVGCGLIHDYDPSGIDLLTIRKEAVISDIFFNYLLASYTYTDAQHPVSLHQPLTATDAGGQVTSYTYNARSQKLTETVTRNGQPETTAWAYDANGYLQYITGPVAGASVGFTYNGFGRVQDSHRLGRLCRDLRLRRPEPPAEKHPSRRHLRANHLQPTRCRVGARPPGPLDPLRAR